MLRYMLWYRQLNEYAMYRRIIVILCNVLKEFRFSDGLGKVDYIADDIGLDIRH